LVIGANDNVINDIDFDLVNFLKVIKNDSKELISMINGLSIKISKITQLEKKGKIRIMI